MEVFYEKGKKYNCRVKGIPYYRLTFTANGKRRQVYGDGEKDAIRKVNELKALSASGVDLNLRNATVKEAFHHWLYDIKRVDAKVKASTFARYETSYRTHIEPYSLMQLKVIKLTASAMQKYVTALYEEHGVSNASIKSTVKVWKMFTKWSVAQGYLSKDPCENLSISGNYEQRKRTIEVFTEAERSAILRCMKETGYEYDTLIRLAFATGMRLGELLGLRWEDVGADCINIERSTAMVTHIDKDGNRSRSREVWETKTENAVRSIPLLGSTKALIAHHRATQRKFYLSKGLGKPEYLFTTTNGRLIDPSSFNKSYRRLLNRAGVPYRKFHAVRHTFATEAIRRGVDVKDLQMLLGHSDVHTTYIYVQVNEDSKRNAIEKMGAIM